VSGKKSRLLIVVLIGVIPLTLSVISTSLASDPLRPIEIDHAGLLEHTGVAAAEFDLEWSVLTSRVGEAVPNDYSGALIRGGKYIVGFKGFPPDNALQILAKFPTEYVLVTNLGFSQQDIIYTSERIVNEIVEKLPGTAVGISPSVLLPELTVIIDPDTLPSPCEFNFEHLQLLTDSLDIKVVFAAVETVTTAVDGQPTG